MNCAIKNMSDMLPNPNTICAQPDLITHWAISRYLIIPTNTKLYPEWKEMNGVLGYDVVL